jgi:hypothetical protein
MFVSVFGSSFGVGARSLALGGGRPALGDPLTFPSCLDPRPGPRR